MVSDNKIDYVAKHLKRSLSSPGAECSLSNARQIVKQLLALPPEAYTGKPLRVKITAELPDQASAGDSGSGGVDAGPVQSEDLQSGYVMLLADGRHLLVLGPDQVSVDGEQRSIKEFVAENPGLLTGFARTVSSPREIEGIRAQLGTPAASDVERLFAQPQPDPAQRPAASAGRRRQVPPASSIVALFHAVRVDGAVVEREIRDDEGDVTGFVVALPPAVVLGPVQRQRLQGAVRNVLGADWSVFFDQVNDRCELRRSVSDEAAGAARYALFAEAEASAIRIGAGLWRSSRAEAAAQYRSRPLDFAFLPDEDTLVGWAPWRVPNMLVSADSATLAREAMAVVATAAAVAGYEVSVIGNHDGSGFAEALADLPNVVAAENVGANALAVGVMIDRAHRIMRERYSLTRQLMEELEPMLLVISAEAFIRLPRSVADQVRAIMRLGRSSRTHVLMVDSTDLVGLFPEEDLANLGLRVRVGAPRRLVAQRMFGSDEVPELDPGLRGGAIVGGDRAPVAVTLIGAQIVEAVRRAGERVPRLYEPLNLDLGE